MPVVEMDVVIECKCCFYLFVFWGKENWENKEKIVVEKRIFAFFVCIVVVYCYCLLLLVRLITKIKMLIFFLFFFFLFFFFFFFIFFFCSLYFSFYFSLYIFLFLLRDNFIQTTNNPFNYTDHRNYYIYMKLLNATKD